jgi:hypothetical protein
MPGEARRDRRGVPRVGLDETFRDPVAAEREALRLVRQLRARVAMDRDVVRRLRRYVEQQHPSA